MVTEWNFNEHEHKAGIKEKWKINKQIKGYDKIAHSIKWLNSLTITSGVVICHNLPYDGTAKENKIKKGSSPREKTSESRHQYLFEENVRKTNRGLRILKRRVWELFTYREGISTPSAHHKGQHPLKYQTIANGFLHYWSSKNIVPTTTIFFSS